MIQATTLKTWAKVMNGRQGIDPMWILCDNNSTVDIIKNKAMVTNIRGANNPMKMTGIGGTPIRIYQVGDLLGYGNVYYHTDVLANIISFHHLARRFKSIKYDKIVAKALVIQTVEGIKCNFMKKEQEQADKARRLHVTISHPLQKVFEGM